MNNRAPAIVLIPFILVLAAFLLLFIGHPYVAILLLLFEFFCIPISWYRDSFAETSKSKFLFILIPFSIALLLVVVDALSLMRDKIVLLQGVIPTDAVVLNKYDSNLSLRANNLYKVDVEYKDGNGFSHIYYGYPIGTEPYFTYKINQRSAEYFI